MQAFFFSLQTLLINLAMFLLMLGQLADFPLRALYAPPSENRDEMKRLAAIRITINTGSHKQASCQHCKQPETRDFKLLKV